MGLDRAEVLLVGRMWEPDYVRPVSPVIWKPRDPFRDTMTLHSMERGRSSVVLRWHTPDERWFSMFASDFMELLLRGDLGAGIPGLTITGTWVTRKSGSSYGVTLVEKE